MRTLRLSVAGTVLLALLGGAGSVAVAQMEGVAFVTGTGPCAEDPGRTIEDDGVVELHHFTLQCTSDMSDPRLSGPTVIDMQQFCLKEEGGHVCMGRGTQQITGPDGGWVGTDGWVSAASRSEAPGWGVLEGTGAYEGWTFWFHVPSVTDPTAIISGLLYVGPPPPRGETMPLTPAE